MHKLLELREHAQSVLGDEFDLRSMISCSTTDQRRGLSLSDTLRILSFDNRMGRETFPDAPVWSCTSR